MLYNFWCWVIKNDIASTWYFWEACFCNPAVTHVGTPQLAYAERLLEEAMCSYFSQQAQLNAQMTARANFQAMWRAILDTDPSAPNQPIWCFVEQRSLTAEPSPNSTFVSLNKQLLLFSVAKFGGCFFTQ